MWYWTGIRVYHATCLWMSLYYQNHFYYWGLTLFMLLCFNNETKVCGSHWILSLMTSSMKQVGDQNNGSMLECKILIEEDIARWWCSCGMHTPSHYLNYLFSILAFLTALSAFLFSDPLSFSWVFHFFSIFIDRSPICINYQVKLGYVAYGQLK